ncbi:MAG: hypothetical protein AB1627_10750 [Chloroflexota bacterium]
MRVEHGTERLLDLPGVSIERIRRAHYNYQGNIDTGNGDIEFRLSDGRILIVDVVYGDRLRVGQQEWIDHFAPPLSEENARFVAESGKWEIFDVSADAPYAAFVGEPVDSVVPLLWDEIIVGVVIRVGGRCLRIRAGLDELLVDAGCQELPAHLDPEYKGP